MNQTRVGQACNSIDGPSPKDLAAREAYMKQTLADQLRAMQVDFQKNLARIERALVTLPTRTLNMTRLELEAAGLTFEPWRLMNTYDEAEAAEKARRAAGIHPLPAGLTD